VSRALRPPRGERADWAALYGRTGLVEWFRPGEHERVEEALSGLAAIGIRRLRTGISWADYHREDGARWYGWLLPRLARDVEVLPCVTYTPPSLGVDAKASSPPRDPKAYADFLDLIVSRYGRDFEWIELWNEPNNLNNWDWQRDYEWTVFSAMVGGAAYWLRNLGKKTVLAGTCPTDPNWLHLMCRRGVMAYIDALGVHGFPGTWDSAWPGWNATIAAVRDVVGAEGFNPQIWITEAGFSTWRHDEGEQLHQFLAALHSDAERLYWYAYQDLHPDLASEEGFHFDERHYHTGIVRADGSGKLLYRALSNGGITKAAAVARTVAAPQVHGARPGVLITGGAGFIGANIADRVAASGQQVIIFDSLARDHVEENLDWLIGRHGGRVNFVYGDVRDRYAVAEVVGRATKVFHLAAQVAVTTSLVDPRADFEINAGGTLNVLEAIRRRPPPPPLVFASTNKVYGHLESAEVRADGARMAAQGAAAGGFDETLPLDFYSPYGCSKGAADQYVLDYARIYNLPAAVFRMSCIYGPRQFGTEDQGWVAHFLISALRDQPITIYGDGRQVRDILFVDDAVEAFLLAQERIDVVRGQAFNIGGGVNNTVSLLELIALIESQLGTAPEIAFAPPRPGDQRFYVSAIGKYRAMTGWAPRVGVEAGVRRLLRWLDERSDATARAGGVSVTASPLCGGQT
jgi:CDP-paratose 2-epimerase